MTGARLPTVEVLIVSYNTRQVLSDCLSSISAHLPADARLSVAVWDNASGDGSSEMVEQEFPEVRLVRSPDNIGFGRANNALAETSEAEYVLLCNSDTIWRSDLVSPLLHRLLADPKTIVVGPRLRLGNGERQASFSRFPSLWHELVLLAEFEIGPRANSLGDRLLDRVDTTTAREVEVLWATCWLIRRADIQAHGLFDEAFVIYDEDFDYCARMRDLGRTIVYEPSVTLTHLSGASANPAARAEMMRTGRERLYRRHRGAVTAFGYRRLISMLERLAGIRARVIARSG